MIPKPQVDQDPEGKCAGWMYILPYTVQSWAVETEI